MSDKLPPEWQQAIDGALAACPDDHQVLVTISEKGLEITIRKVE